MSPRRNPKPGIKRLPRGAKVADSGTLVGPAQPIGEQPAAPQLPPPIPEVVAQAERLLADAKSGLVRAVGLAIVLADARTDARTGVPAGDIVVTHCLNSAVTSLAHLFSKAMHPEQAAQPEPNPQPA